MSQPSDNINKTPVFDGLKLLKNESERIVSHKDEVLVTSIDKLQRSLKEWIKAEHSEQDVKLLCDGFSSVLQNVCLHYKLARKVVKMLFMLEVCHPTEVKSSVQEVWNWNKEESSGETGKNLAMWSQLLEVSVVSRELVAADFSGFVSVLTSLIEGIWSEDSGHWSKERQDRLQLCVKVSLQLCQHLSVSVAEYVWHAPSPHPSLTKLLEVLLCVVDCDLVHDDTRRLAATVFGYVVQLGPDTQLITEAFMGLLHSYETGERLVLGDLELSVCDSRMQPVPSSGLLYLVQGFLSCCRANLFSHGPVQPIGGAQHPTLAIFLLHAICQLCEGKLHMYQAIKTLLLWFQKSQKCPSSLGLPSPHLVTERHPVVSLTLSIVWNNLDSPVDGVSDLAVVVFRALIDIVIGKETSPEGERDRAKVVKGTGEKSKVGGAKSEGGASDIIDSKSEGNTSLGVKINVSSEEETGSGNAVGTQHGGGGGGDGARLGYRQANGEDRSEGVRSEEGGEGLVLRLMDRVMQMSWQVKGKHVLCAVLLPHVPVDRFLEQHSDVWEHLLRCMGTNYMCPPATQVFKALSAAILDTGVFQWESLCLPHLVSGLTSTHSLTCYNACHLWLPWTLNTVSNIYEVLLKALKSSSASGEQLLRAEVSVCLASKKILKPGSFPKPHKVLTEALLHPNDDIRLDAFAFVCSSTKTSEAVSTAEVDLLKGSLPFAMTSDCPPFRQQLQAHIHTLVARVRDNLLANLPTLGKKAQTKTQEKQCEEKQELDLQIELVDWLWGLCVHHLGPGSSFQRLKTSVEWMWVVLDTLVYRPGRRRRKGGCPEAASVLLQKAVDPSKWQFFTCEVTHTLLAGITDGTDEIREQCCNILLEYFPQPLPLTPSPVTSDPCDSCDPCVCGLLQSALSLCAQPRYHDAHGGALLCKLIAHVYAVGEGYTFSRDKNGVIVASRGDQTSNKSALAAFLKLLVQQLQDSLKVAKNNVLEAAKDSPTQGFIVAATFCVADVVGADAASVRPAVQSLVSVSGELVDTSLDILGGRLHADGSAPSFEQMGVSIQQLIDRSQASPKNGEKEVTPSTEEITSRMGEVTLNTEEEVTLSTEHQLLLTWAWLNIRETCMLYSKLSELPVYTDHSPGVLTVQQVKDLGQVMVKILTRCRHRGAIEGSSEALCAYCTKLLQSSHTELCEIPAKILADVMSQVIQVTTVTAASITRRSAGLPLIVKAVLISENKNKQSHLLKQTISELLRVAAAVPPDKTDQRLDLPQVHALNMLKVLFGEASLAGVLLPHTEGATLLALQGFSAPLWAIRNAATQLFSTLVSRMLGQKKTKEDSLHTTTTGEFFSRFPVLRDFLLTQLQAAARTHGRGDIHPSLFPVLAILSRLSVGVSVVEEDSPVADYLPPVLTLLGSPMHSVRERASLAVVALVSPHTADQFLLDLALDLPSQRGGGFNTIHGQLMCLTAVLASLDTNRQQEGNLMSHLLQVLEERSWLGGPDNPCPLVRAAYLNLILKVNPTLCLDAVATELLQPQVGFQQVGLPQLTRAVFGPWLAVCVGSSLLENVRLCLDSGSGDVRTECVELVKRKAQQGDFSTEEALDMQTLLFDSLFTSACPWDFLCACLEALVSLYHTAGDTCPSDLDLSRRWEKGLVELILERGESRPAALAVTVMSICVDTEDTKSASVCDWVHILEKGCDPSQSEERRLNTARCLHITGLPLIHRVLEEDCMSTVQEGIVLRILKTTVTLLVDENSDVRRATAAFVHELPGIPQRSIHGDIHPSYALKLLFDDNSILYVLCGFCQSPVGMRDILSWMEPSKPVIEVLQAEIQGKDVLFESQDLNPYRENTVLLSHISTFLLSHKDNIPKNCVKPWRGQLLQELEWCVQCLEQQCTGILNVSCKPRVCDCVNGLLLRVQVYLSVTGNQADFTKHLLKLSKLLHLHPSLQRMVTNLKSSLQISEDT